MATDDLYAMTARLRAEIGYSQAAIAIASRQVAETMFPDDEDARRRLRDSQAQLDRAAADLLALDESTLLLEFWDFFSQECEIEAWLRARARRREQRVAAASRSAAQPEQEQ